MHAVCNHIVLDSKGIDYKLYWFDTKLIYPISYPYGGEQLKIEIDDVEYITETSLTIRGSRRRTTLPKVIVEKLNLTSSDKIRWILFKDGRIVVTKVKRDSE